MQAPIFALFKVEFDGDGFAHYHLVNLYASAETAQNEVPYVDYTDVDPIDPRMLEENEFCVVSYRAKYGTPCNQGHRHIGGWIVEELEVQTAATVRFFERDK